jgi:HEAT repeat protein
VKRHKIPILLASLVLVIWAAFYFATRVEDPPYNGMHLSEHLRNLKGFAILPVGGFSEGRLHLEPRIRFQANEPTLEAISKVGTNALPMLIQMLAFKDSRIGLWLRSMAENHQAVDKFLQFVSPPEWTRRMRALVAFHRLGPQAAPAVPDIIPLLDDPECAAIALLAIWSIRPDKEDHILSLTNVFRVQKANRSGLTPAMLHSMAILALGTFGNKASGATPILLQSLTSTNERIRTVAAVALARIGAPAESVVPLITANLLETNALASTHIIGSAPIRLDMDELNLMMNIWALGEYGPAARLALPVLSNAVLYPVSNIKEAMEEAFAKIKGDKP